jgi:ketosteroid isomerase-like protein
MDKVTPLAERVFRAVESRDIDAALAVMAPDIVLFDPHYPKPDMKGHAEVRAGIEWGLSVMATFGFTIERTFLAADGLSGAFEVHSHHTLKIGKVLRFPQVFVIETKDGLITRLQAYEPYGPNGMGGFMLGLARLKRRISAGR